MSNKVKYNLKNVHAAKLTESVVDGVTSFSYDTPKAIPGAVSISLDAEGDSSPFYADGIVYFRTSSNNGYSGDLEMALIPEWFRTEILREKLDSKGVLVEKGVEYIQTTSLEEAIPELDILYMTRVQRERFFNEEDYLRLKDSYILTPEKMEAAKPDMCVLHPLPRVNEISVAVDSDPRACYFKQALYGKYMRMALILKLLDEADKPEKPEPEEGITLRNVIKCRNSRCITTTEQELDHVFKLVNREHDLYRCIYCETKEKYHG